LERRDSGADRIELLSTLPGGGYALRIEPSHWTHGVQPSCSTAAAGCWPRAGRTAAQTLRSALALWQGPTLANVVPAACSPGTSRTWTSCGSAPWNCESRPTCGWADIANSFAGCAARLGEPAERVAARQLIDALRRCGRRGEALEAYRNLHTVLDRELGIEPSTELKRLQYEILARQPEPDPAPAFAENFAPGG